MTTAALPSLVRDRAMDVIASRLGRRPDLDARLGDLGNAVAVALMIDLEETFHILIDVDELLPDGTFGAMLCLTELRAEMPRLVREPCNLINLAEARARRAQGTEPAQLNDVAVAGMDRAPNALPKPTAAIPPPIDIADVLRWRRIMLLLAGTSAAAGAFGGFVFFAAQAGWLS